MINNKKEIYLGNKNLYNFLNNFDLKEKISSKLLNIIENKILKNNLEIKQITDFNKTLTKQQETFIENELKNTIKNVKYNSFSRILKIIEEIKNGKYKNLEEAFKNINFSEVCEKQGSECFGMNIILKEKLEKEGIKSYLIRFNAGGYVDNDFIEYGHCGLIIPILSEKGKEFILLDPGIQVSKPLKFEENIFEKKFDLEGKNYKIKKIIKSEEIDPRKHYLNPDQNMNYDLAFCLENHKKVRFCFDPYNEWVNPNETIVKDFLRSIEKFKLLKHDEKGELTHKFSLILLDNRIEIFDKFKGINEKNISFDDFINMKNNNYLKEIFFDICKELSEDNPKIFFENISSLINIVPEFKEKIWSPSTYRKIIPNQSLLGKQLKRY